MLLLRAGRLSKEASTNPIHWRQMLAVQIFQFNTHTHTEKCLA